MLANPNSNPLLDRMRSDLPGRFNEADIFDRHWDRLTAVLQGVVVPPYEVLIHPSSECNLACEWCIGDHVPIVRSDGRKQLVVLDASKSADARLPDALRDPAVMLRLCEDIVSYRKTVTLSDGERDHPYEFGVENVTFSGLIGEPLVSRAAVIAAIRFLVSRRVRVGLFTNAVLLDEDALEAVLEIAYIVVSVDAGTGATYGALKYNGRSAGPAQFEKMRHNVAALVRRRKETGCELAINSAYILYPQNHEEVYAAAKMLKGLGVDCLRLKQDISSDRPLSDSQLDKVRAQTDRIKAELVDDNFKLFEIHSSENPVPTQRQFSTCLITDLIAAVGSDGRLYPCNYHPRPNGTSYGDSTVVSFREIWEGAKRAKLKGGLPRVCPKVCDPFKGRANPMLESFQYLHKTQGQQRAQVVRDELVARLREI